MGLAAIWIGVSVTLAFAALFVLSQTLGSASRWVERTEGYGGDGEKR
jgi:hypothetical protein